MRYCLIRLRKKNCLGLLLIDASVVRVFCQKHDMNVNTKTQNREELEHVHHYGVERDVDSGINNEEGYRFLGITVL